MLKIQTQKAGGGHNIPFHGIISQTLDDGVDKLSESWKCNHNSATDYLCDFGKVTFLSIFENLK